MSAWSRLNFFQRLMLRWRELHPYNPVHVVRVPAALEPQRLRACIAAQLEAAGLCGLALDRPDWKLRWEGGPATLAFEVVDAGGDPVAALSSLIEREFNRPFAAARHENPFRFFAIDEVGAFQLVLVYDHYVAGGDSIARLLSAIACAVAAGDAAAAPPLPLEQASTRYRSVLLRHPWWVVRAALGLPRLVARARRAYRPLYDGIEDGRNAYAPLRIGPAGTTALLGAAKAWGVTLNELLMACLMSALSPLAAGRRGGQRRDELAVASILNMRGDLQGGTWHALSPFLAAYRVSHTVPEGIGLRQLAQDVHAQTRRIRRGRLHLQSLMGLAVSAWLWPRLTPRQRHGFYAKHFAVWAGITSLNLQPIWDAAAPADTSRMDYRRAVPTGPLCPLVLAVTRVHEVLNLGIAYRTAAFSRASVDTLVAAFLRSVDELAQPPQPVSGAQGPRP